KGGYLPQKLRRGKLCRLPPWTSVSTLSRTGESMPYLRVHSVGLPREIKRTLATELTQTVVETRHLRGIERDGCTVQFSAVSPDDLAIGGKLIANGRLPEYAV